MGKNFGGQAPSIKGSAKRTVNAYLEALPKISALGNQQILPTAQAQLEASQTISPAYSQLGLDQLSKYAMPYAQIGQDVQRSNALAGAQTNLQQILGAGGQSAAAATGLSRYLNPNYWNTQSNASRQAGNLLNSFNINGLSPGEYNATERAINQGGQGTGNLGLINNTNTLSNALNFGGAFNQKQALMGNAIGTANQTAQSARNNGIDTTAIALGQPNISTMTNAGFQQLNPITQPDNSAQQNNNTLLSGMFGLTNTITPLQAQANQYNSQFNRMHTFSQDSAQHEQAAASACCFIFLESYNGILPWYVRVERDKYYKQEPTVAAGYKRMAKWLVPLMRKYSAIRKAVNISMVKPLTLYGGHTHSVNNFGHIFWPVKKFWFTLWKLTAQEDK